MSETIARLVLRYRPVPDVLFGRVEHDGHEHDRTEGALVSDSPSDDTVIQWARDETSTEEVLRSFQIIHASRGLEQDARLALPNEVLPLVLAIVEQASERSESTADILARLRFVTETTTELPASSLTRCCPVPARSPDRTNEM